MLIFEYMLRTFMKQYICLFSPAGLKVQEILLKKNLCSSAGIKPGSLTHDFARYA